MEGTIGCEASFFAGEWHSLEFSEWIEIDSSPSRRYIKDGCGIELVSHPLEFVPEISCRTRELVDGAEYVLEGEICDEGGTADTDEEAAPSHSFIGCSQLRSSTDGRSCDSALGRRAVHRRSLVSLWRVPQSRRQRC